LLKTIVGQMPPDADIAWWRCAYQAWGHIPQA